jgi:hypothetical protein
LSRCWSENTNFQLDRKNKFKRCIIQLGKYSAVFLEKIKSLEMDKNMESKPLTVAMENVQQYGAQTKHRMGNQGPDDQRPEPSNV